MADLDTAQRHLADALTRLEVALNRRLAARADPGAAIAPLRAERDALATDVAALRSECERLSTALRDAEHENRTIREATESVARRLDGSIDQLDHLLEG